MNRIQVSSLLLETGVSLEPGTLMKQERSQEFKVTLSYGLHFLASLGYMTPTLSQKYSQTKTVCSYALSYCALHFRVHYVLTQQNMSTVCQALS